MILDFLIDFSRIESAKSKAMVRRENKKIQDQDRECLRKVGRERILVIDLSKLPLIEVPQEVINHGCTASYKTIVERSNQKLI